jgi:hypothetical protein
MERDGAFVSFSEHGMGCCVCLFHLDHSTCTKLWIIGNVYDRIREEREESRKRGVLV